MDAYKQMRDEHPDIFTNDPSGIRILDDPAEVTAAEEATGLTSGVVYADDYIVVVRDPVQFPGGKLGMYLRILPPGPERGVAVLPILAGSVVLVEHYRHATRSWHLEVPRGFGTQQLSPEANTVKEVSEEIGAAVTELVHLGELHPDSGLMSHRVSLFAAKIDSIGALDESEGIRRALTVDSTEMDEMIRSGAISDSFTIAAYTRARLAGVI